MVGCFNGKRGVLVQHFQKLGTPKSSERFHVDFERKSTRGKGISVEASKQKYRDPKELRRGLTREEIMKYVAKLENRKAARADEIVKECIKFGGRGIDYHDGHAVSFDLGKQAHTQEVDRRSMVNSFKKESKPNPRNCRGIRY